MLKNGKRFFIVALLAVAVIIAGIKYWNRSVSQKPFARQESPEKLPDTARTGPQNRMAKDTVPEAPKPISEKDVVQPPLPGDLKVPDLSDLEPKDITPQVDNYDAPKNLAFEQPAPSKAEKKSLPSSEGPLPPQKGEPLAMAGKNVDQTAGVTENLPPATELSGSPSEKEEAPKQAMPKNVNLKKRVMIGLLFFATAGMVAFVFKR